MLTDWEAFLYGDGVTTMTGLLPIAQAYAKATPPGTMTRQRRRAADRMAAKGCLTRQPDRDGVPRNIIAR